MNLALVLCLAAAFFYATEIVVAEKGMKGVPAIVITLCVAIVITGYSSVYICYTHFQHRGGRITPATPLVTANLEREGGIPLKMPTKWQWGIILVLGGLNFLADWAHYSALKGSAGGTVLATFYVFIPVFCTILRAEGFPSWKMVIAWALGAIALYLISDELTG